MDKRGILLIGAVIVLLLIAVPNIIRMGAANNMEMQMGSNGNLTVVPAQTTNAAEEEEVQTTVKSGGKKTKTTAPVQTTEPAKTTKAAKTTAPAAEPETEAPAPDDGYVEYKFRSKKLLNQHFDKHGGEFDYATAEEYEKGASDVINNPDALYKIEAEDGDGVYYVEATNEFVILSTDGYIRTYFKPSGGIDYFNRQ